MMERRQISIVSSNFDTVPGEDEKARNDRHRHNDLRATQRQIKVTQEQAEQDLDNADGCNPRNRHSPIRPRNLEDDFVLDYDSHDVFATPSANMAAMFQVFEHLPDTPEIAKARARLHVAAAQT